MFPHACGEELARLVAAGADPKTVVPDDFVVVRGGTKPVPGAGTEFSCSVGPTLEVAGCGVPHSQVRTTTAGAIRATGGTVEWFPELMPNGTMNEQHVHVTEGGTSVLGELQTNPVPKAERVVP
jgi:hypothetical protein